MGPLTPLGVGGGGLAADITMTGGAGASEISLGCTGVGAGVALRPLLLLRRRLMTCGAGGVIEGGWAA